MQCKNLATRECARQHKELSARLKRCELERKAHQQKSARLRGASPSNHALEKEANGRKNKDCFVGRPKLYNDCTSCERWHPISVCSIQEFLRNPSLNGFTSSTLLCANQLTDSKGNEKTRKPENAQNKAPVSSFRTAT